MLQSEPAVRAWCVQCVPLVCGGCLVYIVCGAGWPSKAFSFFHYLQYKKTYPQDLDQHDEEEAGGDSSEGGLRSCARALTAAMTALGSVA